MLQQSETFIWAAVLNMLHLSNTLICNLVYPGLSSDTCVLTLQISPVLRTCEEEHYSLSLPDNLDQIRTVFFSRTDIRKTEPIINEFK